MVAYSFRPCFIDPILSGRKRQTIRAISRRRHARPGDPLQLYTGMRTKNCRLIGRARCIGVVEVGLRFDADEDLEGVIADPAYTLDRDAFAQRDGFADWGALKEFWRTAHPTAFAAGAFAGVMICWGDLL
jgi:hypothetical protein